jgi:IS1 family transposase
MSKRSGPDFVVAGLMKSSTSWLYKVLSNNSNFDMPIIKEINYFNYLENQKSSHASEWMTNYLQAKLQEAQSHADINQNIWSDDFHKKYYEKLDIISRDPFTSNWYKNIFSKTKIGCLTGDVSPAYATLDNRSLRQIRKHNCKVILIFRNPLDRLISGLRMHAEFYDLDLSKRDKVLELLKASEQSQLNLDYRNIYEKFSKCFGSQLKVFSYEKIHRSPQFFFDDFLGFLGIEKSDIGPIGSSVVFPSQKILIPEWLSEYSDEKIRGSTQLMSELVPN